MVECGKHVRVPDRVAEGSVARRTRLSRAEECPSEAGPRTGPVISKKCERTDGGVRDVLSCGRAMNFRRHYHERTDSTSERAFSALALGKAQHGDVHVAGEQTAGRGRFGRSWHSAAGEGLYLSVILLPERSPWPAGAITVAAALAAFDAVEELGLAEPWLDWPNDLRVGEAKLAGVLVETRGLDPKRPHYVVGIGLNVRQREFPEELRLERPVTSLALLGLDVALVAAERQLLECFSRRIEQIDSTPVELEVDFVHATRLAHREVRVKLGESDERGQFAGFSFAAGVLLHLPGGREKRLPLEFVRSVERLG